MMDPIEALILDLLAKVPAGKSIAPEDVARGLDAEGWRRQLGRVRGTAVGLARQGKIVILRHNKPADPDTFRGVWRMRLPMEGDGA
ncbi:MAG: hypothetical protein A2790_20865 [Phenylobacterium sp. RIFCSPHIGHO2_01_FULL_69_31]|nr:DUF3253 domain-containing protein [Phenylobacterium sp. RIFCSPHIGHO2_01_FULL_69_31]OHB28892.1 MAG: hypothetical protein A2790_20865 [Phenylobacterium sp. RIFCSPHIGHO2_01_FULL_69_31]